MWQLLLLLSLLCRIYGVEVGCYNRLYSIGQCWCKVENPMSEEELLQSVHQKLSSLNMGPECVNGIDIVSDPNNTNIDRIPSTFFSTYPILDTFDIRLKIKQINPNDLVGANNLEKISLTSNKLRKLSAGTFQAAPKLKFIYLTENEISTVDDFAFANLSDMRHLYFQNNKVTIIKRNTFTGLSGLRDLDLSTNEIHTIEIGAFADLEKLEQLILNQNRLRVLNQHVFDGPVGLRVLLLDDNALSNIDLAEFTRIPNLRVLDLKNNGLNLGSTTNIPKLQCASPLYILDLSSNNLTTVSLKALGHLFPNLRDLDVRNVVGFNATNVNVQRLKRFLPKLWVVWV